MALGTLGPRSPVNNPRVHPGGGGRPPVDRSRGGGWGGGRGGDGAPDYGERLRRYRLGMAVALVSIVMLFLCFSAAYLLRENTGVYDMNTGAVTHDWQPLHLPMALLWLNTLVLIASSVTIELARRQAVRQAALAPALSIPGIRSDDRFIPWLPITVLLGFAFLGGQWLAWLDLGRRGWLVETTVSSSFFYVLTGTHALHIVAGLVALLYAMLLAFRRKPYEQRRIVVDVTAWYWHVIDILWIYLFVLLAYTGRRV